MGPDELNLNSAPDDALSAGVAENLVATAPGIELPEADFAVPLYIQKGRRAAASFIFLTITLDMLALGMIAPVLPRLIASFMAGNATGAARMLGYFGTIFAVMQFFFSPVLGSLSLQLRPRPGLPADGVGARAGLAVCRPRHLRTYRLQHSHWNGVHDRRHAGGEARQRVWPHRRGVRHGLRARPGARRNPGQRQSAASVLGRGWPQPAQRHVWPLRAARVAEPRTSQPLLVEAREPRRLAPPVEEQQGAARTVGGAGARLSGTTIVTERLRADRRLPLRLDRQISGLVARAGRGLLRLLWSGPGQAAGEAHRRTQRSLVRTDRRHAGLLHVRPLEDRPADAVGHSRPQPDVRCLALCPEHHVARGEAVRAGADAGRGAEPDRKSVV